VLTYDRDRVLAVAASLLSRITVRATDDDRHVRDDTAPSRTD